MDYSLKISSLLRPWDFPGKNTGVSCHFLLQGILLTQGSNLGLLHCQMEKHLPAAWKTQVWSVGRKDPLKKGMATHSSTLAWRIPWMEEPGRLQSMGLQRVRHDWATSLWTIRGTQGYLKILLFSHLVMSDSLWPHGLQHASLLCPSLSPRTCSNSSPLSPWSYLTN